MDKRRILETMRAALAAASAARDWNRLCEAAEATQRLLNELADDTRWTEAEDEALRRLYSAHQLAYDICCTERLDVAERMRALDKSRTAQFAYSSHSGLPDGKPA